MPGMLSSCKREMPHLLEVKCREMEIVSLPGSTSDRIIFPRLSLLTVCDVILTAETFIRLSNHLGEEAVSPFLGALPTHLDQSGRVAGTSFQE